MAGCLTLALSTTACADPKDPTPTPAASGASVAAGNHTDRVRAQKVDSVAARVPAPVRDRGELRVVTISNGVPPLAFMADDNKTVSGAEIDIAQLVADVLGLRIAVEQSSWENLFLAVKSGKYDAAFSNITVTAQRGQLYDFATYRTDSLAWEVAADSKVTAIQKPADIAGLTVGVGSGSTQEKILLDWVSQVKTAGLPEAKIQYYQSQADYWLALKSGRIQAFFGPHSLSAYHVLVAKETKLVGVYEGTSRGHIGAMTTKGSGLADAIAAALNELIANGKYAEVLKRWGLEHEAVSKSEANLFPSASPSS
ncbi:ABC transporter substrate-binding protein [Dactylosporangium sp. NPDC051485]|uniref:ABC transporter substrate-binding protein n=1 Tax=Dactylosporangium sp. NPDC051485 TaxID=3154846 RepID=UPI00342D49E7